MSEWYSEQLSPDGITAVYTGLSKDATSEQVAAYRQNLVQRMVATSVWLQYIKEYIKKHGHAPEPGTFTVEIRDDEGNVIHTITR